MSECTCTEKRDTTERQTDAVSEYSVCECGMKVISHTHVPTVKRISLPLWHRSGRPSARGGTSKARDRQDRTQAAQGTRRRRSQQQQRSRCPGRETRVAAAAAATAALITPAFAPHASLAQACKSIAEARVAGRRGPPPCVGVGMLLLISLSPPTPMHAHRDSGINPRAAGVGGEYEAERSSVMRFE